MNDKKHTYHKIRTRLWIYFAVFLISLVMSIIHYVHGQLSFYFPLGGFISGFLIGHIVSRMHKVSWDENSEMIDLKLDALGVIILVIYLLFVIFKNSIIEDIVHMHHISSISLTVLSGTMLGHAVALRKKIWKLYKLNHQQTDFSNKNKTQNL